MQRAEARDAPDTPAAELPGTELERSESVGSIDKTGAQPKIKRRNSRGMRGSLIREALGFGEPAPVPADGQARATEAHGTPASPAVEWPSTDFEGSAGAGSAKIKRRNSRGMRGSLLREALGFGDPAPASADDQAASTCFCFPAGSGVAKSRAAATASPKDGAIVSARGGATDMAKDTEEMVDAGPHAEAHDPCGAAEEGGSERPGHERVIRVDDHPLAAVEAMSAAPASTPPEHAVRPEPVRIIKNQGS